jgi:hypothetical protein
MKKINPLVEKWTPLLENEALPEIVGAGKKALIAKIMENQE